MYAYTQGTDMDQTTLNLKFLTALNACNAAKQFIKRNNLEAFPISMLDQIQGDHNDWVEWIKNKLNSSQLEFDSNGNMIHSKDFYGFEYWQEYDSNGNMIHFKNSNGMEYWQEYDSNWNMIHSKHSYGAEYWQEYDSNGNMIHYKDSDGYEYHYPTEYYPNGQIKRYGNMILPNLNP